MYNLLVESCHRSSLLNCECLPTPQVFEGLVANNIVYCIPQLAEVFLVRLIFVDTYLTASRIPPGRAVKICVCGVCWVCDSLGCLLGCLFCLVGFVLAVAVSGTAGLEASWRFLEALAWLIGTLGGSCTVGRLLEALAHLLEGLGGIRKVLRGTLEVLGRLLGGSWRPRRRTLRLSELVLAVNVVRLTSLGRLLEPTWEVSGDSWRSSRRSEPIFVIVTEHNKFLAQNDVEGPRDSGWRLLEAKLAVLRHTAD